MTINIKDASSFTVACRKLQLTQANVGISGLRDLIELSKGPAAARPIDHNRRTSFCDLKHVGVLIAKGLAAFDRERQCYHITDKGRAWLNDLCANKLISQH